MVPVYSPKPLPGELAAWLPVPARLPGVSVPSHVQRCPRAGAYRPLETQQREPPADTMAVLSNETISSLMRSRGSILWTWARGPNQRL